MYVTRPNRRTYLFVPAYFFVLVPDLSPYADHKLPIYLVLNVTIKNAQTSITNTPIETVNVTKLKMRTVRMFSIC